MKIADGIDEVALSAYRQFAEIPNFSLHRSDVVKDHYLNDMVKFIAYSGMPVRWGNSTIHHARVPEHKGSWL